MAVTFYYSTMGAGKSTFALQLNHQLKSNGFNPFLAKSATDVRDEGVIKSRIGLSQPCHLIINGYPGSLVSLLYGEIITHLIIDEVQFIDRETIIKIIKVCDRLDVDVICFGLRTSYTAELFEGAATLFALADNLIELPTLYKDGNKTIMHVLTLNGKEKFDGDMIHVGDQEYESVSRKEYFRRKELTFS